METAASRVASSVSSLEKNRVVVEGVNFVTKHVRVGQTQRGTKTGGIETMEAPIHVSNVALVDPDTKLPARVGFKEETDERGKTTRVRYSGEVAPRGDQEVEGPEGDAGEAAEKPAKSAAPKAAASKATKDAPADKAAATEKDAD